MQREPDRKADQTATWSLMTVRAALRQKGLPAIAAETIRQGLHEAGYSYQRTRTSCPHGLRAARAQKRHRDDL